MPHPPVPMPAHGTGTGTGIGVRTGLTVLLGQSVDLSTRCAAASPSSLSAGAPKTRTR